VTSPKSVRAARWLTSGDPRKSAISGKRRRFSATTSLPICQVFRLDPPPISLDHAVFVPRRKREGGPHAERLPNRRAAELIDFEHDRGRWTVTIGRYPDGRIAEIFLDAAKESPLVELAQESAIIASLALQSGCPLNTLRHAVSGRSAGPLGAALGLIEGTGE
jgi:hypothetical protein